MAENPVRAPTVKGLNELMRIQVSDYNFKSKPGTNETGFIAQQLYTVLPEVVTPGGDNPAEKPWAVDYGRVTPLLTRAIQEQQGEIEALKEQNRNQQLTLKAENAKLRAENIKLEAENAKLAAMAARNGCVGKSDGHDAGEGERRGQDSRARPVTSSQESPIQIPIPFLPIQ